MVFVIEFLIIGINFINPIYKSNFFESNCEYKKMALHHCCSGLFFGRIYSKTYTMSNE